MRKNRKALRWGIFLLLCLLAATVPAYIVYRSHTVPVEECSQLYRGYADNPHVTVAFIKDFPVNDTLAVDVTTLQATTDSAWCALLLDFGTPQEMIDDYNSNKEFNEGEDASTIILFYRDKNDLKKRIPSTNPDSRLVIASHRYRTLCIFMTEKNNIKETIELFEIKKLKNEKELQKNCAPRSAEPGCHQLPERRCVTSRRY